VTRAGRHPSPSISPAWLIAHFQEQVTLAERAVTTLGPRPPWWRPGARRAWTFKRYEARFHLRDAQRDLAVATHGGTFVGAAQ
jgi:hypothetical protein